MLSTETIVKLRKIVMSSEWPISMDKWKVGLKGNCYSYALGLATDIFIDIGDISVEQGNTLIRRFMLDCKALNISCKSIKELSEVSIDEIGIILFSLFDEDFHVMRYEPQTNILSHQKGKSENVVPELVSGYVGKYYFPSELDERFFYCEVGMFAIKKED